MLFWRLIKHWGTPFAKLPITSTVLRKWQYSPSQPGHRRMRLGNYLTAGGRASWVMPMILNTIFATSRGNTMGPRCRLYETAGAYRPSIIGQRLQPQLQRRLQHRVHRLVHVADRDQALAKVVQRAPRR